MLTTPKIYQFNTYNKVNLFNRRVPVIPTILRNVTPQYTTKQDFPTLLFSHPTLSTLEYLSGYLLFDTPA